MTHRSLCRIADYPECTRYNPSWRRREMTPWQRLLVCVAVSWSFVAAVFGLVWWVR